MIAAYLLVLFCGSTTLAAECPEKELVQNFEVEKYTGLWYEISKYPNPFQKGGKCTAAEYTLSDNGVVVNNTQILDGKFDNIVGSAVIAPDANGRGKLLVTFVISGVKVTAPYSILATDYDSYAVVWSCEPIIGTLFENAWILARAKTLNVDQQKIIDEVIETRGLDKSRYVDTDQTNCP